ncbi:MAG TPA: c-type cytochrome [Acidimicrobiales bacterium]|nr:c-type cytochrome [Acidimicrobiales bacterium]
MIRGLLRNRYLRSVAVLATVGLSGVLGLTAGAGADTATTTTTAPSMSSLNGAGTTSATTSVTTTAATTGTTGTTATATTPTAAATATTSATGGLGATRFGLASVLACHRSVDAISYPGGANAGSPKGSTFHICVNGQVTKYGNSAIVYHLPPDSKIPAGRKLFEQTCSSCHGREAEGTDAAPPLRGVGPATVDFWVTTGRMPAATPLQVQADRKPARYDKIQADEIAAFINSLTPAAPYIPKVNVKGANVATGADLFALNCAACHTILGAGDELAYGTSAPTLHIATARQVAEAIRTGPGNMPWFTGNLSDNQVRDIVAYVTQYIQHPVDPGGAGLGGIGPVTEGFVALLFGVGGFMLICFWIGDRA